MDMDSLLSALKDTTFRIKDWERNCLGPENGNREFLRGLQRNELKAELERLKVTIEHELTRISNEEKLKI
tara:strand:+ start:231 stop:440 length:210 start_codon:yes stop_codon:yes gene_type:complete